MKQMKGKAKAKLFKYNFYLILVKKFYINELSIISKSVNIIIIMQWQSCNFD